MLCGVKRQLQPRKILIPCDVRVAMVGYQRGLQVTIEALTMRRLRIRVFVKVFGRPPTLDDLASIVARVC